MKTRALLLAALLVPLCAAGQDKTAPSPYRPVPAAAKAPPPPPPGIAAPVDACFGPCYNLAWSTRPNLPFGNEGAAASYINGKYYVSHGLTGGGTSLLIYDPVANSWSNGPAASVSRTELSGTAAGTRHYAFGGRGGMFGNNNAVEIFDTLTNTWSSGTPMPTRRRAMGVAAIGNLIHVIGGTDQCTQPNCPSVVSDHEVYDTVTDSWSVAAPLPFAMGDIYSTVAYGGKIYVFGGYDGVSVSNRTQIYDPATNSWSQGASLPTARSNAVAGVLSDKIVVAGGLVQAVGPFGNLTATEIYDPATDTWCLGPSMPIAQSEISSCLVSSGSELHTIGSGPLGAADNYHQALVLAASNVPPTLNCPSDLTVGCPADQAVIDAWLASATASSACDPNPIVSHTLQNHEPRCGQTFQDTYLFTATDSAGNEASCVRTVTSVDSDDPVLNGLPGDLQAACDNVPPAPTVTATDACDPNVSVTPGETRTDGNCPDNYVLNRSWSAVDACGNDTTALRTVTVTDTQAPILSGVPLDATVECDAVPPQAVVTAQDNCDPNPVVTPAETRVDGNCPANYTLIRTWSAPDRCGNPALGRQVLTVRDTHAPTLSGVPGDATVPCDAVPAPPVVTATDNCDTNVPVSYSQQRIDGNCPDNYQLVRTWSAVDDCGNPVQAIQTLTVVDTGDPVLQGVPPDQTVECPNVPPPPAVTALDNCDPNPAVVLDEDTVPGNCPGNYSVVRTWTATDRCGNQASDAQTITVRDTTPPVIDADPDNTVCLWPPNHWYVCFDASDFTDLSLHDTCSDPVEWRFTGCQSDQPDEAPDPAWPGWNGDGNTRNDCVVLPEGTGFCVRAERCGTGPTAQSGRHYAVTIEAVDACGNQTGDVRVGTVHVPHDQSPHQNCLKTNEVGCRPNQPIPCRPRR